MAELNEVVNEVKDVVMDNAPQVTEAAKQIVTKIPNVLAERAKGAVGGVIATVIALKGIPAAIKAIKKERKTIDKADEEDQVVAEVEAKDVTDEQQVDEVNEEIPVKKKK